MSKKNIKSTIKKSEKSNGSHASNPLEIAEKFNSYFANIGEQLADQLPNKPHTITSQSVLHSFSLHETTTDEVSNLITALNPRKENRVNDIPTSLIKISNQVIAPYLYNTFNTCMKQGCYPELLKIAHVVPIHKKGSKDECSNYKPISLLSNFNRLFEKNNIHLALEVL